MSIEEITAPYQSPKVDKIRGYFHVPEQNLTPQEAEKVDFQARDIITNFLGFPWSENNMSEKNIASVEGCIEKRVIAALAFYDNLFYWNASISLERAHYLNLRLGQSFWNSIRLGGDKPIDCAERRIIFAEGIEEVSRHAIKFYREVDKILSKYGAATLKEDCKISDAYRNDILRNQRRGIGLFISRVFSLIHAAEAHFDFQVAQQDPDYTSMEEYYSRAKLLIERHDAQIHAYRSDWDKAKKRFGSLSRRYNNAKKVESKKG